MSTFQWNRAKASLVYPILFLLMSLPSLICFGQTVNAYGSVISAWGDQSQIPRDLTNVVAIAAGNNQNMALRADGTVVGWGQNGVGQASIPLGLTNVAAIAAGEKHALALKADGTVVVWGDYAIDPFFIQFAPTNLFLTVPADLTNVVAIAAGANHDLALKADGTVVAWGSYYDDATTVPLGLTNVVAIAAGGRQSLAIKADGTVVAWGGYPIIGPAMIPKGLSNIVAVSVGGGYDWALKTDGTVVSWELWYEYPGGVVPIITTDLTNVVAISGHYALKGDGTVVARSNTNILAGLTNVASISSGYSSLLALVADSQPHIIGQPQSKRVELNQNAQLAVIPWGRPFLRYQWQKNGFALSGATNSVLTIAKLKYEDAGNYSVVVTNNEGHVTSQLAALVVMPPGAPVLKADGQMFFDTTTCGGRAVITMTSSFANGILFYTTNNTTPNFESIPYDQPITITNTTTFRVIAYRSDFSGFAEQEPLVVRIVPTHTITTNLAGLGSIQTDQPAGPLMEGAVVRVWAKPDAGWLFDHWEGDASGSLSEITLVMTGPKTITAVFKPIPTFTLITSALGGGHIDGNTSSFYYQGNELSLSAAPNSGWQFLYWKGDASGTNTNTVVVMDNAKSVEAVFGTTLSIIGTGPGTISTVPAAGPFPFGSTVMVVGTPDAGNYLGRWGSSASGSFNPLTFVITNPTPTISALFAPLSAGQFLLSVDVEGPGTISAVPAKNVFAAGDKVTITAIASPGMAFAGWSGDVTSADITITLTMDGSKTVKALFARGVALQAQALHGSVAISPNLPAFIPGREATLTAVPDSGWRFTGWSGDISGSNNPAALLMDTDKAVTAVFAPIWHLSTSADAGGLIIRNPDLTEYLDGDSVSLTAVPQPGFAFAGWSGGATGVNSQVTLTMNGNTNVEASFRDISLPVITISTPQPGDTANENFILSGSITDNVGVASARWEQNGVAKGPLSLANGKFSIPSLKLVRGENRFQIYAQDALGNEGSNDVVVTWNPVRTLTVVNPADQVEGQKTTVPVELISQGDVGGMSFIVRYDTNYLRDPDWAWFAMVEGSLNQVNFETPGEVRATFAMPATALPAGTNSIGKLTLRTRSVPENISTGLQLEVVDVASPTGQKILFGTDTSNGEARILKRRMVGDDNGNNRLDIGDATLIQRLLTGLEPKQAWDIAGNDLNASGDLDSGDVIAVLRVVAGIDAQPRLQSLSRMNGLSLLLKAGSRLPAALAGLASNSSSNAIEQGVLLPSSLSGKAGDLVTLQVVLRNLQTAIAGATFTLDYPTNVLRLTNSQSHQTGALAPANSVAVWNVAPGQNNYITQIGKVTLAVSSNSPWPKTNGVLAELTFQVQLDGSGQTRWPLKLSVIEITPNGYDTRQLPENTAYFDSQGSVEPQPPRFSSIVCGPGEGVIRLTLMGETGLQYEMLTSTNLTFWTTLGVFSNINGTIEFTNHPDTNYPQRYFQAKPAQ